MLTSCYQLSAMEILCRYCKSSCKKCGRQSNGKQKYRCLSCGKYQQAAYSYPACSENYQLQLMTLTKEGCGIRSTSRILGISVCYRKRYKKSGDYEGRQTDKADVNACDKDIAIRWSQENIHRPAWVVQNLIPSAIHCSAPLTDQSFERFRGIADAGHMPGCSRPDKIRPCTLRFLCSVPEVKYP